MQLKRSIQNKPTSFLVQLTVVGDDVDDMVTQWRHLMFANAFQPLPNGLLPEPKVAKIIPLEPHGKPPSRLIYKLSPLELQEANHDTCYY